MTGTLRSIKNASGEEYGRRIAPLGDINNDGLNDWAVGRFRSDTLFDDIVGNGVYPEEFLIYLGERGRLPLVSSGRRIGPDELGVLTSLLCAGDFDADGNRDIVCRFEFIGDTSYANQRGWQTNHLIVFWGDGSGRYGLGDTTRLQCAADIWIGLRSAGAYDLSGDLVDDLLVLGGGGLKNGENIRIPQISIFRGGRGRRWGRNGVGRTAEWFWWSPPAFNRISNLDHDCDGARDLALYHDDNSIPARIAILYGRRDGFPDTTSLEALDLTTANGHSSLLSDVTGDGTLDLLVNCGFDQMVRVYAGRPGQRLAEQYGSGNDAPVAGRGWWRRPWAEVWLPYKLHDGWRPAGFSGLFDIGDVTGDGISEIWVLSRPDLCGYMGGLFLDSLIDAGIAIPGTELQSVARLGDIDGSGMSTIAVGYDDIPHAVHDAFPGGVLFVRPDTTIYANGGGRYELPHLSGERCNSTVAVAERGSTASGELLLQALPNPSGGDVIVRWPAGSLNGQGTVRLLDETGRELWRRVLPLAQGEAVIPTQGIAAGAYYVSLIAGVRSATVRIIIQ
jgi:hypothetical protein